MRKTPITKQFTRAVKRAMKDQGVTQSRLSADLKISRVHLADVLEGRASPTLRWAAKVCKYLKLELRIDD